MRGMFHRHFAATAMIFAAAGGALAQPATLTSQPSGVAQPSELASQPSEPAPPSETNTIAPAAAPAAQPPAGVDLSQAPLATSLQATDLAVAERVRELLAAKSSKLIERKQDRPGVEAFYRDRGFAPLWIVDGVGSARAKAAIGFLRGVDADGLDPADYPAPGFANPDADKLAQDELAMTNSILAFVRHARTGRVSFSRVSGAIFYGLEFPEPATVLASMATADHVGDALGAHHPQHSGYKALKAKLAEARGQKKTVVVDTLIANMERWRWMPRDLGRAHVTVNIPDYTLKVTHEGKTVWSTRIVVGKVGEQATPLLSETMKFITVNPTWNVPPSIIRNEYLPALQRDPGALQRIGLKVTHRKDGSIHVYQPPGEKNALGRIRFNFPNRFLVYQHDTPQKHLFAKPQRAFSHGCMRVQNPEQYAEVLLSITQPGERMTAERLRKMYGETERTINFKMPIPVHITYQTAFVDDSGVLQTRPDIYGHDKTILGLLRNGRGGADTPIARNYNSSSKPVVARLPGRPDGHVQVRFPERTQSRVRDRGRDRMDDRRPGYVNLHEDRMVRRFDYIAPSPRQLHGIPF